MLVVLGVALTAIKGQVSPDEKAHQLLVEVDDWFSEGIDTPDLQEARGLLNERSSV